MTVYIKLHLFLYTIFDNFKPQPVNIKKFSFPKCHQPHERHPPDDLMWIIRLMLNRLDLLTGTLTLARGCKPRDVRATTGGCGVCGGAPETAGTTVRDRFNPNL